MEPEAEFTEFGPGQVASRSQPPCCENGVSIDYTPVVPVVKTKEVMHGRPMVASGGPGTGALPRLCWEHPSGLVL